MGARIAEEMREMRKLRKKAPADEETRRRMQAMLDEEDGRPEVKELETGVDDIMAALAESERMELEAREQARLEQERLKAEGAGEPVEMASFIQKGDYESKVKEEAEAEAARLALEEE